MSWASVDKLALAKPRADGRATVVVSDERLNSQIAEVVPLSTVIAIARVLRGRRVLEERGRPGVVVYQCKQAPPQFLIDAVTAAGGIVFDGTREHVAPKPLALTVQLDAAFLDLATVVRRRLKVADFAGALDVLESTLQRQPAEGAAVWPAVMELIALTAELVRDRRPARWIEALDQRLPLALDLGAGTRLYPAQVAQTIATGGAGSLRSLVMTTEKPRTPTPAPKKGRAMPLLCARTAVALDQLAWRLLVDAEADHPNLPVIVWVEDLGESIHWPLDGISREAEALANLEEITVEVTPIELPLLQSSSVAMLAVVTGDYFAAETLLSPATMQRVREALAGGSTATLLVGVPCRGHLIAIDAARALVDDDLMASFLGSVKREYVGADEADRISPEVIIYAERPLGRVQSNLAEARQALRELGVDPDA
ncbi:MAG: hypothetical protein ABI867_21675 [Kofleriaceae bacterium]